MVYSVPFLEINFKGIITMNKPKPLLLLILDGWGCAKNSKYNAITNAKTPQWSSWLDKYPHMVLDASGKSVGLPSGQIGNSEVGHMHIGAGRVVLQDFSQINADIESEIFFNNETLKNLSKETSHSHSTLHILGLLSPGGVHSHEDHLIAFLKIAAENGTPNTAIHLFLDGRDVPPRSAFQSINKLEKVLKDYSFAKIVSMCGRFYAMDRDKRWDRIQETYDLLTLGNKSCFPSAQIALQHYYDQNISDEFIPACSIGLKPTTIQDNDSLFFYNFRADRAIQLTECFILKNFDAFPQALRPKLHDMVTMVPYSDHLPTTAVYPKHHLKNTIGEIVESQGYCQLRIAETEKFPHVTYFLNGGKEEPFLHEERILIPSPKVRTYNLQPEMRVKEITDAIIENIASKKYQLIIANFANPDMVGHCGEFQATVEAIEAVDKCFEIINKVLETYETEAIITADHGNAEIMFDEITQQAHTAHTMSPVPFLFIGKNCQLTTTHGSLIDIAPTILELLKIPQPHEMSGKSLLIRTKV